MADVLLVQMPFARLALPSLGLGIVAGALDREGVDHRVRYENLRFAERVGLDVYACCEGGFGSLSASEWAFCGAAFPDFRPDPGPIFAEARAKLPFAAQLLATAKFGSVEQLFAALRARADAYLDWLVDDVLAQRPRVVGCTSMFTQHIPALALLRRLKQRAPEVVTVMGGASCAENMGRVTHRVFDWVDYVFLGEADDIAGPVFAELVAGRGAALAGRPEMASVLGPFDRGAPTAASKRGHPVADLDAAPAPDFTDYLAELRGSALARAVTPGLLMEFSRGCRWAEHRRCTFCGIERYSAEQRSKSPERVERELRQLIDRHGVDRVTVVDNQVERPLIRAAFDKLARWEKKPRLFLEARPAIDRDDLELLAQGGCRWVQTGIESLDDDALLAMRKGASAARSIQLLRWGEEAGVEVQWNWIVDFPGEDDARYERLADLVPLLVHLEGPQNVGPLLFVRNGAYLDDPERFGLRLTPDPMYRQLYPFTEADAAEFAYLFRHDGAVPRIRKDTPGRARFHEEIDRWMFLARCSRPPRLVAVERDGGLEIEDTRPIAPARQVRLEGPLGRACAALFDGPATEAQLRERWPGPQPGQPLEPLLEELVRRRLAVKLRRWYVGLPVRPGLRPLPSAVDSPMGYVNPSAVMLGLEPEDASAADRVPS